jgi:hypothetical protein
MYAGQYAWISLLFVGVVLFLFRKNIWWVVGALPLNGGAITYFWTLHQKIKLR